MQSLLYHMQLLITWMLLISFKSLLIVEVWDNDDGFILPPDDIIDIFTFPLSNPLNEFNQSSAITHQGLRGIGKLTLSYGNLTTCPTPCNTLTVDSPVPSNSHQGTLSKHYVEAN